MASAISVLRQALAQAVSPEPDEVVRHLNGSISDNLIESNRFITLAIARYTPSTGRLVYANAGHLYPMVWSHQAVTAAQQNPTELPPPTYLQVRGVPLGILPVWKAKSGEITLQPGDALLLASDGLTEATVTGLDAAAAAGPPVNEAGGYMLRQEGLWYLLQQQPASLDLDVLLATLNQYTPDHREDDQTILSLEVL
jgi:serine phosphatase RsbU (regulator of sigma subunit)